MKIMNIYIHIPFCVHKCYYCDFISFSNKYDTIELYVEMLKKEIILYRKQLKEDIKIETVYIGGGTPSLIDSKYILGILDTLRENFLFIDNAEITIEINPGTINKFKLQNYMKYGINRLSIGLQTTDNNLLKKIGRIHTYEDFLYTFKLSREIGFNNINIDLMLALPEQTLEKLIESVNIIIALNPEHISVYSLILEKNTKLYSMVQNKKMSLPDDDLERQMYWSVKYNLEKNGYKHYEISNFAKCGYESRHNCNCWEQKEYIGFGVNAHSYENRIRFRNVEDIEKYISKMQKSNCYRFQIIDENQTKFDQEKEFMLLGLRKIDGIYVSEFKKKFIENPLFLFREQLNRLVKKQLIVIESNNIRLTNKGIDFANIVFQEFI